MGIIIPTPKLWILTDNVGKVAGTVLETWLLNTLGFIISVDFDMSD